MPGLSADGSDSASDAAARTVIIVDDDELVRGALRTALEQHGYTVYDYGSGEAFLEGRDADFKADGSGEETCLLIDAAMPGMSGLELLQRLQRAGGSRLPATLITGNGDVNLAVQAMKAGASDFIEKPVGIDELLASVGRMLDQAKDLNTGIAWREAAAGRLAGLTAREREVMDMVLAGQTNKSIAANLGISPRTVETHRASIMKKTETKSLPALARLALAADGEHGSARSDHPSAAVEAVVATPDIAGALENDTFKRFLDQIPTAVIVSDVKPPERIVYANPTFEQLYGQTAVEVEGKPWSILEGTGQGENAERQLGAAILGSSDFVGTFQIARGGREAAVVDAYSNLIENEEGTPVFRLAALVDAGAQDAAQRRELEERIGEKDMLLLEIQHRVKNNLQMITALIRIEARNAKGRIDTLPFDRLAGRINAMQLIYKLLSEFHQGDEIDLGIYLSEIASSVMHAHAVEGIRLDLKVDAYPVSVNVAMPAGLVVNELLTNALKHAFVGRDGGTITLHSLADSNGCRVVVADDGVGLPEGTEWPKRGKLGELIARSLRENANAKLEVESSSEKGMRVTITFTRAASAPDATRLNDAGIETGGSFAAAKRA
jgi:PAS domain S-box-containing protein